MRGGRDVSSARNGQNTAANKRSGKKILLLAAIFAVTCSLILCIPAATTSDVSGDDPMPIDYWTPSASSLTPTSSVYTISSPNELAKLGEMVNGGNTLYGYTVKLTGDLDLSAHLFSQIGSSSHSFEGTFDGDGFTITGLKMNDTSSYLALFRDIGSFGTVKNLGLIDTRVIGNAYSAGIAGYNSGTIDACFNIGQVSGSQYVGGIAGYNYGTIKRCFNTGDISGTGASSQFIGGITGWNDEKIEDCYNTGDISGANNIGGITGRNHGGALTGSISRCYNTGDISGIGSSVGSIAGQNSSGGITNNCYWLESTLPGGLTIGQMILLSNSNGFGIGTWNTGPGRNSNTAAHLPELNVFESSTSVKFKTESKNSVKVSISQDIDGNFVVDSAESLITFIYIANTGSKFEFEQVILDSEIDMGGYTIVLSGNSPNDFNGTFDGKGFTISDLTITSSGSYKGMFSRIGTSGTVKNLGLIDSNISGTGADSQYIGGIAGYNNGTITYTYNAGIVTGSSKYGISTSSTSSYSLYVSGIGGLTLDIMTGSDALTAMDGFTSDIWVVKENGSSVYYFPQLKVFTGAEVSETFKNASLASVTRNVTPEDIVKVGGKYVIDSEEKLVMFSEMVGYGRSFQGEEVILTENLNMTGIPLSPIGNYTNKFEGTFDGNGKTISNLTITPSGSHIGLFGYIGTSGTVRNLGLIDPNINGPSYVGGIAGYNSGTISNCYNTGGISGSSYVGGIAGGNNSGTITNCYNTGDISATNNYAGGIAGYNSGTISNCYNTGGISGSSSVGGITGWNNGGTITKCYNVGVAPMPISSGNVTNSYWWNYVGTNGLPLEEMTGSNALNAMTGFDADDWILVANEDQKYYFPQLKVFAGTDADAVSKQASLKSVTKEKGAVPDAPSQTGEYTYMIGDDLLGQDPNETAPTNIPGTFAWKESVVFDTPGTDVKVTIIFTPTDAEWYVPVEYEISVTVLLYRPVIADQTASYEYEAGQKLSELGPNESVIGGIQGDFTWADENYVVRKTDTEAMMVFTPKGSDALNYSSVTFSVTINVTPLVFELTTQNGTYEYKVDQMISDISTDELLPTGETGNFVWSSEYTGMKLALTDNGMSVVMRFVPTGDTAYKYDETEFDVTITVILNTPAVQYQKGAYEYTAGQRLSDIDPNEYLPHGTDGGEIEGTITWKVSDRMVRKTDTTATMIFTPSEENALKYTEIEFEVNITATPIVFVLTEQNGEYWYDVGQELSEIDPDELLPEGVTGEFTWSDGTRVPIMGDTTATMIFTPTGSSAEFYDACSFDVEILVRLHAPAMPELKGIYVYEAGQSLSEIDPDEDLPTGVGGTYTWKDGSEIPGVKDTVARMVFTPTGDDAMIYREVEFDVTISVTPREYTIPAQKGVYGYTAGQRLSDIGPDEDLPTGVAGTYTWVNGNNILSTDDTTAKIRFTPTGSDAELYAEKEFTVSITVQPAPSGGDGGSGAAVIVAVVAVVAVVALAAVYFLFIRKP